MFFSTDTFFCKKDSKNHITILSCNEKVPNHLVVPAMITIELGETFPVTAIAAEALMNRSLETVTLPETISSIGARAFAGNPDLKPVRIPASVKIIADYVCKNGILYTREDDVDVCDYENISIRIVNAVALATANANAVATATTFTPSHHPYTFVNNKTYIAFHKKQLFLDKKTSHSSKKMGLQMMKKI
jgi:BspA type Leucine rich repeat region (6 copies)